MDRDTTVSLLKSRLKRTGDSAIAAQIITEMQFVQETILEGGVTLPFFLMSENLTASTEANEERIVLPAGFLREHEEGALWLYDTTNSKWSELKKEDYDAALLRYGNTTGQPKMYSLDGKYFRLKPTPDKIYTLRIRCFLADNVLSSNIENDWLKYANDWFIGETGYIMASKYLKDSKLANEFMVEAAKAKTRVFITDEARKHANRDYVMGD